LDWIKSLDEIPDSNIYFLKGKIDGTDFEVEIHTKEKFSIHTKLYVYDKAFVISSANITPSGMFERHMELGILITEEDNELEVRVVKKLFEENWIGKFGSCEGIRREILYKRAEKLLESLLSDEIENNKLRFEKDIEDQSEYLSEQEIGEGINDLPDYSKNYFSWRIFCFGCDEGRSGKIITKEIELEGKRYAEIICESCDKILEKIRDYLPPFAQDFSHEGYIGWRISRDFYKRHEGMIEHYSNKKFFYSSDDRTVVLSGSDDGTIDELIRILVACKLREEY